MKYSSRGNSLQALLALGALSLLLSFWLSHGQASQFLQAYLWVWVFWVNLAAGSLALLEVHRLTDGAWGARLVPVLLTASRTLLPLAILGIPVLLGTHLIYPWAHPTALLTDPKLAHQAAYLNPAFFVARSVLYFLVWMNLRRISTMFGAGAALVLYFLTSSFAAIDWVMSLEPHWYSTAFGFVFITTQAQLAMAFAILLSSLRGTPNGKEDPKGKTRLDIGNLLLASSMTWGYVLFMQFLVIWSGNLPEEASWYVARRENGWSAIAIFIAIFQLALPFSVFLFRNNKKNPRIRGGTAAAVFLSALVYHYWLIFPSFHRGHALPRISDLLCLLGLSCVWISAYRHFAGKALPGRKVYENT